MPHETPHETRDDRAASKRHDSPRDDDAPEAGSLAGFELLADPTTISGGTATAEPEAKPEVERLRADLERREREIEALRVSRPATEAAMIEPPRRGSGHAPLDLSTAAQLAEEAHRRERVSREALEMARAALSAPSRLGTPRASSRAPHSPADSHPGWATRALVTPELPSAAQVEQAASTLETAPERRAPRRATAQPSNDPELRAVHSVLEEAQGEITCLRSRIAAHEREIEAREEERDQLRRTLCDRERDLAKRSRQLAEAREHFDAQAHALETTRAQLAQERRRNTTSQKMLERLRNTLSIEHELPGETDATRSDSAATLGSARLDDRAQRDPQELEEGQEMPASKQWPLPAIFDAWQDDQIRRHFGPIGVDSLADLLRAPIARRAGSGGPDVQIVLIGRGAWSCATKLADELVHGGTPPFLIHVADPDDPHAIGPHALAYESPLRELLRALPTPDDPEALALQLAALPADVLVSRHFLSRLDEPEAWLDALDRCRKRGCALVFAERTGAETDRPSSEMGEIGDRIWQLMPERYKRARESEQTIASWREAFARIGPARANGCLAAMRRRFDFDLFAQFGHLAEPFVSTEIGGNFAADASRDRRFLAQVADVDDRKIEAGIAPALHLVALVDPAASGQSDEPSA